MWIPCVILALAAGAYALWPLFAKTFDETSEATGETDTDYLVGRKTAVYRNIRELEFEYKMGRLTESDFRALETEYKDEATEILQKLDALNALSDIDARGVSPVCSEERGQNANVPGEAGSFAITPEPDAKEDACPACGAKTITSKKFCADCGARL